MRMPVGELQLDSVVLYTLNMQHRRAHGSLVQIDYGICASMCCVRFDEHVFFDIHLHAPPKNVEPAYMR